MTTAMRKATEQVRANTRAIERRAFLGLSPSEADIRAILDAVEADIGAVIYEFTSPLSFEPPKSRGPAYAARAGKVWDDLRPSQAARLESLLSECFDLEDDIHRLIVDKVTAAALTFAAEYPDAPRVRAKVPA